jgi:hypothetical protein
MVYSEKFLKSGIAGIWGLILIRKSKVNLLITFIQKNLCLFQIAIKYSSISFKDQFIQARKIHFPTSIWIYFGIGDLELFLYSNLM